MFWGACIVNTTILWQRTLRNVLKVQRNNSRSILSTSSTPDPSALFYLRFQWCAIRRNPWEGRHVIVSFISKAYSRCRSHCVHLFEAYFIMDYAFSERRNVDDLRRGSDLSPAERRNKLCYRRVRYRYIELHSNFECVQNDVWESSGSHTASMWRSIW